MNSFSDILKFHYWSLSFLTAKVHVNKLPVVCLSSIMHWYSMMLDLACISTKQTWMMLIIMFEWLSVVGNYNNKSRKNCKQIYRQQNHPLRAQPHFFSANVAPYLTHSFVPSYSMFDSRAFMSASLLAACLSMQHWLMLNEGCCFSIKGCVRYLLVYVFLTLSFNVPSKLSSITFWHIFNRKKGRQKSCFLGMLIWKQNYNSSNFLTLPATCCVPLRSHFW